MTKDGSRFTRGRVLAVLVVAGLVTVFVIYERPGETGNETSAIAWLKVTTSAQIAYSSSCGNGGFAPSFLVLGTPPPGEDTPFISDELGGAMAPRRRGYVFTLGPGASSTPGPLDCNGTPTITAWLATAVPETHGKTGSRSFAVTADNVVWQQSAPEAPNEPFGAPATRIQ